ncbi:18237_t:CDS:2, partial [Cetraspora pellucida]
INDDNIEITPRSTPNENPSAGMSGLFTALLLKEAGIKDVTILEYQNRVGGRVHTHYFTDDPDDERRLYGELGAMRLPYIDGRPDLSVHQLIFDTIDYLNDYNKADDPDKEIKTIPFIYSNPNALYYFNNKKAPDDKIMTKNYSSTAKITQLGFPDSLPDDYTKLWPEALVPFFEELGKDFTKGLEALKRYDQYSAYSYLNEIFLPKKFPTKRRDYDEIIRAIEMNEVGTGIVRVHWKTKGEKDSEVFDRVVVTAPLGCIRHWDLPPTLSYKKRRALRELDYVNAAKIFLQFKSRFWEKSPLETGGLQTTTNIGIVGGTSSTDLPIRTIVYPSYYQGLPTNGSGVLLASYTWANDAAKFSPFTEEERFELALKDLETIHGKIVREEWISGEENNKAHYWTNDKTVVGGSYAKYGVGQLEFVMGAMMRSEDFIHWAGEHTDIHNAWIVGALNSAVRVVKEILQENLMNDKWLNLRNMRLLKYWNGNLDAYEGY